jgi:Arc/MetJ-type ribon-helix-helix transcriptional regulator
MQITLTRPIEEFIQQQLERGYADASEVARQAFLRWMEDEDYAPDPPRLREKLLAACHGQFHAYQPEAYDSLIAKSDEAAR